MPSCANICSFPLKNGEDRLLVAVADPLEIQPLNDLAVLTGMPVELALSSPEEIIGALNRNVEKQAESSQEFMEDIPGNLGDSLGANLEPADLLDTSDEAPLIRFVNSLITQGYKQRASDIHIEPFENEVAIRYRVDGILYTMCCGPRAGFTLGWFPASRSCPTSTLRKSAFPKTAASGCASPERMSTSVYRPCRPPSVNARSCACLDKSSSILTLEELGMERSLHGQGGKS